MTGGLQTTGQRLTDRHAAPTAAETDTHHTYSQQEHSMSNSQSMATVQRPPWATHSRIAEELPASVYHGNGYEVHDQWADNPNSAETVTVEVYVSDTVDLRDSHVVIERDVTLVELTGGIVSLPAAAEYADALVTALAQAVGADADEEIRGELEHVLAAVENLKGMVRQHVGVLESTGSAFDTFRSLNRCEHGESIHGRCPQCDTARKAGA